MAKLEKATFGAGCFWGVQSTFDDTKGVVKTEVGYEGGAMKNPLYKDVCTDATGHAEVVEITFDHAKISYRELLDIFWNTHDPHQVDRQGPDVGSQYRSVIFFHSPRQESQARESLTSEEKKRQRTIATHIVPATTFYPAEGYHQKYLQKKGLKMCH